MKIIKQEILKVNIAIEIILFNKINFKKYHKNHLQSKVALQLK